MENTRSSLYGGVAVLEREETKQVVSNEALEDAKIRMRQNLDKLLNYDKVEEYDVAVAEPEVLETPVVSEISLSEEDIRPTSTTMQFGDGNIDQMYNEMKVEKTEEKKSYVLSAKGKLALVLYSLAVIVIMALIVINTGVLASLSLNNTTKTEQLASLQGQYTELSGKIADISNNEHVIEVATNEFGMIQR